MKILYSSRFKKSFKKLPLEIQKLAVKRLRLFQKDPFKPQLKAHKLSGKLENYWSFSVNYSVRVIFEFMDEESVGLVEIGTHQIYKD